MKKSLITIVGLTIVLGLSAQQPRPDDPMGQLLFSPELVMQNQQALNLTESQRGSIMKEMQSAQSEFMNIQWELQKEMEKFKVVLEKEKVNETEALDQLDRMLAIENQIKKKQISLLLKIKSSLSADQQEILRKKIKAAQKPN